MKEILIDVDIILQLQISAVSQSTNIQKDQLVTLALEKFLCGEGYNNLAGTRGASAA